MSDPSHPRYGQHLSANEVNQLVKPTNQTLELVHEWLLGHSIDTTLLQYSPAKDWIKVTLPIKSVESLLDTSFSVFKHEDGSHLVRAPQWSLPLHLHEHIETIQPTNSFVRMKTKNSVATINSLDDNSSQYQQRALDANSNPSLSQACNASAVTPLCLRKLYGQ